MVGAVDLEGLFGCCVVVEVAETLFEDLRGAFFFEEEG
jgi:hypothetical protein